MPGGIPLLQVFLLKAFKQFSASFRLLGNCVTSSGFTVRVPEGFTAAGCKEKSPLQHKVIDGQDRESRA